MLASKQNIPVQVYEGNGTPPAEGMPDFVTEYLAEMNTIKIRCREYKAEAVSENLSHVKAKGLSGQSISDLAKLCSVSQRLNEMHSTRKPVIQFIMTIEDGRKTSYSYRKVHGIEVNGATVDIIWEYDNE